MTGLCNDRDDGEKDIEQRRNETIRWHGRGGTTVDDTPVVGGRSPSPRNAVGIVPGKKADATAMARVRGHQGPGRDRGLPRDSSATRTPHSVPNARQRARQGRRAGPSRRCPERRRGSPSGATRGGGGIFVQARPEARGAYGRAAAAVRDANCHVMPVGVPGIRMGRRRSGTQARRPAHLLPEAGSSAPRRREMARLYARWTSSSTPDRRDLWPRRPGKRSPRGGRSSRRHRRHRDLVLPGHGLPRRTATPRLTRLMRPAPVGPAVTRRIGATRARSVSAARSRRRRRQLVEKYTAVLTATKRRRPSTTSEAAGTRSPRAFSLGLRKIVFVMSISTRWPGLPVLDVDNQV